MDDYVNNLNLFYASVLSHEIGVDGKYLFAITKSAHLAGFALRQHLKEIYDLNENEEAGSTEQIANRLKPSTILQTTPSYCLALDQAKTSNHVAIGGEGKIDGYSISQMDDLKFVHHWCVALPSDLTRVNALIATPTSLLAGCSDNNIYHFDRATNQMIGKLGGHQDYVHVLKHRDNLLYSGGEDGLVCIWDLRTNQSMSVIAPYKNETLERRCYSKWIGGLDVSSNGEWLVCGGGPKLSMWHLRSQACVKHFQCQGITNVVKFVDDDDAHNFVSAGSNYRVDFWNMAKDEAYFKLASHIENIYSISQHNYDDHLNYRALSIAGSSFKIQICKNQRYIDCELYLN